MKKPPYISHYLILTDLLKGEDVRAKSDVLFYLTSRIENVKYDLAKKGLEFEEEAVKKSEFSHYKPYLLKPTPQNIQRAKELRESYKNDDLLEFLEQKQS
jgi:hypothetical protein